MESILTTIKKLLGITEEYKHFDPDLMLHINSVFSILTQLGIGPKAGFSIMDEYATWEDYLPSGDPRLEMVKTYIHLKVKMIFDPPLSSAVAEACKAMISELESRLNYAAESGEINMESEY